MWFRSVCAPRVRLTIPSSTLTSHNLHSESRRLFQQVLSTLPFSAIGFGSVERSEQKAYHGKWRRNLRVPYVTACKRTSFDCLWFNRLDLTLRWSKMATMVQSLEGFGCPQGLLNRRWSPGSFLQRAIRTRLPLGIGALSGFFTSSTYVRLVLTILIFYSFTLVSRIRTIHVQNANHFLSLTLV